MHNTALVAQSHVAPREHIVGDGLPEYLDTQHISYYLLRLSLDVGVYKGDVVVATYYIAKSG
jgi:hypothetical protein